jgi:DNA-binding NarL/FixJ family response regulator
MIRLLLADDHPVFLSGLQVTFDGCDDIEVVGTASDGEAVVKQVDLLEPDVVLMDIRMAPTNGIDATRQVVALRPETCVVVLTMFDDEETVFTAMAAGARGYLVKGAPQERIVEAVRAVAAGQVVFGHDVAAQVLAFFTEQQRNPRSAFPALTERETQVLELMAGGLNNPAIARTLGLSEKTVRNNVSVIFAKLHVADRSEAIVRARRAGLGGP